MTKPRILIIDDQYGCNWRPRNEDREYFCAACSLLDVSRDVESNIITDPVAEAVFLSGQRLIGTEVCNDLDGTVEAVRKGWNYWPRWAFVLLDLHFKTGILDAEGRPIGNVADRDPDKYFGLQVLERLSSDAELRDLPIVLLSSMERSRVERRFGKSTVLSFIEKDMINKDIVAQLLHRFGMIEDESIIGRSIPLLKCLREARERADLGNDNSLVIGETGTGKELIAKYLHRTSRRTGQYEVLFTHGVSETLIEARLFGHVKGAFTGATTDYAGCAEIANKGTLFIDEFGDIPAGLQTKLLRLLDKNVREVQRIGSTKTEQVDLQVVLATNRTDILNADSDFRRDLLYRVGAIHPIVLPPLRSRSEDIPLLVSYFARKFERTFDARTREITEGAIHLLVEYSWPGNVRQLESVIERAIYRYRDLAALTEAHLDFGLQSIAANGSAKTVIHGESRLIIEAASRDTDSWDLQSLDRALDQIPFDPRKPKELVGKLKDAERLHFGLIIRLLSAALQATSRPSPEHPEGEVLIHPAMKLLTDNPNLSASKAADLIKRLLTRSGQLVESEYLDPWVRKAYATALRLRPRKPTPDSDSEV